MDLNTALMPIKATRDPTQHQGIILELTAPQHVKASNGESFASSPVSWRGAGTSALVLLKEEDALPLAKI